jgi:hypothetical protein
MTEHDMERLIRERLPAATREWLQQQAALVREEKGVTALNRSFAFIPRKTGVGAAGAGGAVVAGAAGGAVAGGGTPTGPLGGGSGAAVAGWAIDRICRVWLLMQVDSADQSVYLEKIDNLFSGASMNEEVALYSALPVLAYPGEWQKRCAVGVRSNIGPVLEAIMYDNPYPGEHLAEPAWNQMVLKAFFTDKDVRRIVGLDQRANPSLAGMLFDYARERKAAGRGVDPQLWRLTAPFPEADRGAIGG